jgi:cell wall-associated NlpC family hydrolase
MSRLVQQARTYLGVPYRHRGRSRAGVDCAGLPKCAYADLGVELPDLKVYGREPHKDGLMDAVRAAFGEPVWQGRGCPRAVPQVGDVVVLAFVREPHHLAIVGDDRLHGLSLIHADGTLGVSRVVEHGLTDHFLNMIVAVCRRAV